MGRRDLLDDAAIAARLGDLAWTRDGAAIRRVVEFASFRDAVAFVNQVAVVAEELDHHPDLEIRYRTVELRSTTHDRGGITSMDLELAGRIDSLVAT